MSTARRLFAERGYADVSAADIVTAAGLSRGALYHHYTDKSDLFKAVFTQMEIELTDELRTVLAGLDDPSTGMAVGLDTFLSACERDEVVRIMLTDAPAVLGWREWRRIETEHGLGLMTDLVQSAMDSGAMVRQPVRALSQLLLSAIIEAALLVADAGPDERPTVRDEVRQGLVALFAGLAV